MKFSHTVDISSGASLKTRVTAGVQPPNSRSVLITPIENQEGVRLAKKVFLVQLVGAQLHGCNIL